MRFETQTRIVSNSVMARNLVRQSPIDFKVNRFDACLDSLADHVLGVGVGVLWHMSLGESISVCGPGKVHIFRLLMMSVIVH